MIKRLQCTYDWATGEDSRRKETKKAKKLLKNCQGNRNDTESEQGKMIDKGSNKRVGEDAWESNEEESWQGGKQEMRILV